MAKQIQTDSRVGGHDVALSQLKRIAALIGRPVEAFLGDKDEQGDLADAAEMLRLWLTIKDSDERRRLLVTLRAAAQKL